MPSSEVMHKFKHGTLHSGSKHGPVVKNKAQAKAIAASEARKEKEHGGEYPEKRKHKERAAREKRLDGKSI